MEYPHGHVGHHRHQNHRNNDQDDDSNYPQPPPPFSHSPFPPPPQPFGDSFNQPPPPHHQSYNQPPPPHQSYGDSYNQPPHQSFGSAYDQPPPQPHHQSHGNTYDQPPPPQPPHQSYGNAYDQPPPPSSGHHGFQPHMPSFVGSHSHHGPDDHGSSGHTYGGGPGPGPEMGLGQLENKPGHSIHCKAGGERFVFAIRDDKVILTHPDSSDLSQQWFKDEKYSTKVKDKEGHPSFVLVNKGTGQAVKHSVSCHPVQLTPYKPDVLDEAVLWTESKDLGSGYRTIRTVNNVHLVMDAWNADKDHGGIHNGTVIALYETWKGDNQNQQWKFVRH